MSTTSPNKLIVEPAYGDASWNTPLNANLVTLDQALGSSFTVSVGTGGTTTLTSSTPASGGVYWYTAQQLLLSPTGNLTSNVIVTIPTTLGAGTMGGAWIVLNNLTSAQQGSYTVTFQTATGTGVTIAQGTAAYVFSNGTNVYYADNNILNSANLTFVGTSTFVGSTSTVAAGSFSIGSTYTIASVGTTSFTSIGASSNTVGVSFVATGAGAGSGTAYLANAQVNIGGPVDVGGSITTTGIVVPRTVSITTATTITPTSATADIYEVTALASNTTIAIPSGSPVDGQKLTLRFTSNGTGGWTFTWTTSAGGYRIIGTTLPTTIVASKTIYVGCIYNSAAAFWDVVAVGTQA